MSEAIIVRPYIYEITGAHTVQIDQTANRMRKLDAVVNAGIFLSVTVNYKVHNLFNFFI